VGIAQDRAKRKKSTPGATDVFIFGNKKEQQNRRIAVGKVPLLSVEKKGEKRGAAQKPCKIRKCKRKHTKKENSKKKRNSGVRTVGGKREKKEFGGDLTSIQKKTKQKEKQKKGRTKCMKPFKKKSKRPEKKDGAGSGANERGAQGKTSATKQQSKGDGKRKRKKRYGNRMVMVEKKNNGLLGGTRGKPNLGKRARNGKSYGWTTTPTCGGGKKPSGRRNWTMVCHCKRKLALQEK